MTTSDRFEALLETLTESDVFPQSAYDETIVPVSVLARFRPPSAPTLRELPALDRCANEYRTVGLLGQGGMAVVESAEQVRLRREVALKRVRPERRGEDSAWEMVREGWLMGSLEHPNVVPIHALAFDDDDSPMLVMKRVEGQAWRDLLRDPSRHPDLADESTRLVWHLRVLMMVCDAVAFAHSRGILHRDIKPQNVMIGAFGEVYLLDWGVAVSTRAEDRGRLLLDSEATGLAGTPAYLAPEILQEKPPTVLSDIFLLGATLHEIMTGAPPHQADTMVGVLWSIFSWQPPSYPDDVPTELADIARRAMAREPADRFPDAQTFKRAVADFLDHRESNAMVEAADARLEKLVRGLGASPDNTDAAWLHLVFNECRFGYQQALRMWPANRRAEERLEHALQTMVTWELDQGEVRAAVRLLDEMRVAPAELRRRASAMAATQAAERQETERLKHLGLHLDTLRASHTRGLVAWLVAIFMIGPGIALGFAEELGYLEFDYWIVGGIMVGALLETIFGVYLFRRQLMVNEMSRRIALFFVAVVVTGVVQIGAAALRGLPPLEAMMSNSVVGIMAITAGAILLDRRLVPVAVYWLATYLALSAYGQSIPLLMAVQNLGICLLIVFAWWGREATDPGTGS